MKRGRFLIWLGLVLLLGAGLTRLRFDVEVLNLLPTRLPVAQGLKDYQQNFADARELIVTLEAPTAEEAEAGARSLASVLRTRSSLVANVTWQPAWMESPAQATELIAALWLNQPPDLVRSLAERLAATNVTNTLIATREQLATSLSPNEIGVRGYDPFGLMQLPDAVSKAAPSMSTGDELFASRDGTFRLMFVEARPDIMSYRACRDWLREINETIGAARAENVLPSNIRLQFTGRPAFVTEIAGGMEGDMTGSAGGTLVTIGILFWLTHRRLRPLFWLLALLGLTLVATTALGGLFLGTINVVSMGFASILLGLAEDFGIVIYQESRSHPELDAAGLRHQVAPGIFWSAITTSGAFLILNLSTLPGLGQLGTLVAIGIVLAAFVMVYLYLPPLLRWRRQARGEKPGSEQEEKFLLFATKRLLPRPLVWSISLLLLVIAIVLVAKDGPRFDNSPNALKPKNSEANAELEQIKKRFGRTQEPLWVLVPGTNETQVSARLAQVEATLSRAVSNRLILSYTLPTALWPQPAHQQTNRAVIGEILRERQTLRAAALDVGFATNSLFITENILEAWSRALSSTEVFWPTNDASRWVLSKVFARPQGQYLALGFVHPTGRMAATKELSREWPRELSAAGVILSGWELLGSSVFDTVVRELPRVLVPIFILVVISLGLAFRNVRDVVLSLGTLVYSSLLLAGAMELLGWEWNILNLMALPLLLGMGVDYSIHIQLALRRYGGDLLAVRRSVGRALLLAGSTTVVGFGSLAFSSNTGMASLGKVCALGIALTLLSAVYALPVWWKTIGREDGKTGRQ